MRGERSKYNDLKEDETFFEFYKRHTSLETYETKRTVYSYFEDFIQEKGYQPIDIDDPEAEEFCRYIKSKCGPKPDELGKKSAEEYVERMAIIFAWIAENTDYLDWEPFSDAVDEVGFEYDDRESKKRELRTDDIRQYLRNIGRPNLLMLVVLLLKLGLRIGEASNLRLEDINIDHPISKFMPEPRNEISGLDDTAYIDSSYDGNKKKSYREIPIDEELKSAIVWYIAQRPPTNDTTLIVDMYSNDTSYTGMSISTLQGWFTNWSKSNDLWTKPHDSNNIHPHWCRHWFTTVLRANIDDGDVLLGTAEGYVQGLRGDTDSDVIDTYTHEWNTLRDKDDLSYREVYESAMPNILCEPGSTEVDNQEPWKKIEESIPKLFE
jgi:integrase/recombinase XerD